MHFTLDVYFNTATYTLRNSRQRSLSRPVMDVIQSRQPHHAHPEENSPILPNAFYGVAFVPERETFNDLSTVSIPGLEATLYPFQKRAVQWLLMREQVKYSGIDRDGNLQLVVHPPSTHSALPFSFSIHKDINGQEYYASNLYHLVTRDVAPFRETENSLRGGILAEEMGLGKTLEVISLILAHRRGTYSTTEVDTQTDKVVHPTGATLIVAPDTLQNQWISEFKKHAPSLFVVKYPGIKVWTNQNTLKTEQKGESQLSRFISRLADCDVVITTYSVLQAELHYAEIPPDRSMRHEKRHERQTSPLVKIDWWRICLDEAQQVDSGVSSAAKVACLIPRVNSWAVTGTPVKGDPSDLWGLLLFLRHEPFASYQLVWKALIENHKALFGELFGKIAIRHSKRAVRDELKLPSQKRYLVTLPFTAIEEHHYRSQLRALLAKAGLNEEGVPFQANWRPDNPFVVESMKKALANLRQTVLHPSLGSNERVRFSVYKTLAEHLETMIENAETTIRQHQRAYLLSRVSRGQLLENSPRVNEAVQIWEEVLKTVQPQVQDAREDLQKALKIAQEQTRNTDTTDEQNQSTENADDQEPANEEALETAKVRNCRRILRSALDLQHRVTFLLASGIFQVKSDDTLTEPDSDEFKRLEKCEVEGYESAKEIRRELLQEPLAKASRLMKKLQERADTQSFIEIPDIIVSDIHGIETGRTAEHLGILAGSLNEQADAIDDLRENVIQLLLKPLVDAEDDQAITGEEYEDSTKVQDHLMVYSLTLGALIGDRQEALTGLPNERIRYEVNVAEGMAKEGEGHAPEKLLELLEVRAEVKPQPRGTSLRGIIGQLRELSTELRHNATEGSNRARAELQIVNTQLRAAQDILTKQTKATMSLEKDLEFFTSAINARVEFYRQLQDISDSVATADIQGDFDSRWQSLDNTEAEHLGGIKTWNSNRSHLIHMREDGSSNDLCAICCDNDFRIGSITTCGHKFCKACIVIWLRSKQRCPICKDFQTPTMLKDFSNGAQPAVKQKPMGLRSRIGTRQGLGVYSDIPSDMRRSIIQDTKLNGPSYSTKVDTLVKHLIWLQGEDPGAKSIIFTQFRTFFRILAQALREHRIGFASFTTTGNRALEIQRFKDDPTVQCLLMDAKAHSSGLNLVNANHVFLCEPLLNTALELQAIARVDRIGQEHETTVWLYVVENTVDENIHALSERRRLEHIAEDDQEDRSNGKGKGRENGVQFATLEDANSRELEQSIWGNLMDKGEEGETVDKGDLWECLFGRAVEDLEEAAEVEE
ncbi:SNF2 family N-terminal domain-containing protein [Astrocystis sublimbata]|nr:SNF2 family N-terminal domain-containing protein [Astrocystis sublimbata]